MKLSARDLTIFDHARLREMFGEFVGRGPAAFSWTVEHELHGRWYRHTLDQLSTIVDSVPPSVGEVTGVLVGQSGPRSRPRPHRRACWAAPSGGGSDRHRIHTAHGAGRTARPAPEP